MKAGVEFFMQLHSGSGHSVVWSAGHIGICECGAGYYSAAPVLYDSAGRYLGMAQHEPPERPAGPWNNNRNTTGE
jgi:hypothetical protein